MFCSSAATCIVLRMLHMALAGKQSLFWCFLTLIWFSLVHFLSVSFSLFHSCHSKHCFVDPYFENYHKNVWKKTEQTNHSTDRKKKKPFRYVFFSIIVGAMPSWSEFVFIIILWRYRTHSTLCSIELIWKLKWLKLNVCMWCAYSIQ